MENFASHGEKNSLVVMDCGYSDFCWVLCILVLRRKISEWFDKIRGIEYEYVEEDEDDDE